MYTRVMTFYLLTSCQPKHSQVGLCVATMDDIVSFSLHESISPCQVTMLLPPHPGD
jgi:hypothetical protein